MRISDWSSDVCSSDLARDAAELIEVDYDPLPAALDTRKAADPDAPQIWPEAPDNTSFLWEDGDRAAVDAAFARAAPVVKREIVNNRIVVNPLERSEERRGGNRCVRTGRARWLADAKKKHTKN